jgi:Tfp pilus assembly protein PilN
MRAVNLLPSDSAARKSFRKEDPAVVIGSALGAVVLIALVGGFMNVHSKVNANQKKLTAVRAELAQLSLKKREAAVAATPKPVKPSKPIIPVPAVTSEEAPRLEAISTAMSSRIAWDRILREFSLVLPSDVTLTALTLAAPPPPVAATVGAPPVAGVQGLSIAGSAYSHDGVARLLARMMLIPDLTNVTLSSSTEASTGDVAAVQFIISAEVKGLPPLPPVPVPVIPAPTDTSTEATS